MHVKIYLFVFCLIIRHSQNDRVVNELSLVSLLWQRNPQYLEKCILDAFSSCFIAFDEMQSIRNASFMTRAGYCVENFMDMPGAFAKLVITVTKDPIHR